MSVWHWAVVGGIACALWWLMRRAGRAGSGAAIESAPPLRTTGSYSREVVGESNYQDALRRIANGATVTSDGHECIAILHPERNNRYDENAVAVLVEGNVVGYLARDEARLYRGRLKRAGLPLKDYSCPAKLFGGGRKHYGIWLDLPDRLA